MIRIIALVLVLLVTWSCSQHSSKPAAVTFHNINAKYNAIWQADRLLFTLHKQLADERIENYASELPIIAPVDSTFGISHKLEISNLIRKASLVIDRHQNSAYVDDAYLLIAEGRLLLKDYKNAVETLKYINTIEPDIRTQKRALTLLYQVYLIQNDFESAEKAETYLIENELIGTDYYLAKAYEHQQKGEINASINSLNQIAGKVSNRSERSRLYFILGQLNERINQRAQAQEAYQTSMRQKSNYELTLRANIANKSLEQSIPALEKMLADPKNEDQQAEIYVAIGKIHLEQKNLNQAKVAWEKATKNNSNQGELYVQLGNLFANQIKDYPKASAYFDSAAISLSNSHPAYFKVQKLKKEWNKYVELAGIITQEDSLQQLAKLSPQELESIYRKSQEKKNNRKDSIAKIKAQPQKTLVTFTRRPSSPDQQSFYFYNEQARLKGEQEFNMKWGIRTLEDFWNRKNKQTASLMPNVNQTTVATEGTQLVNTQLSSDSLNSWLNSIPRTDVQLLASNKKKEQALFDIGKFCKTQMGNNALARQHLKRLLTEFPYSSFEAEALYLSYLCSENKQEKESSRSVLFDRFPDSIFKLTILKLETGALSDTKEEQAEKAYEATYLLFKSNGFSEALVACQQMRINFPGSKSEDKIVFLSALCQAGLKNMFEYEKTLKQFIQLFPSSPLKPEAEARIKAIPKNK
jgi:tetratricopeptide (TPR) repeat protein